MGKRKRRGPYKSGYCAYAPHQYPCKGEFQNGASIKPFITLCSCECHGDYEARLQAAGIVPVDIVEDDDDDEGDV